MDDLSNHICSVLHYYIYLCSYNFFPFILLAPISSSLTGCFFHLLCLKGNHKTKEPFSSPFSFFLFFIPHRRKGTDLSQKKEFQPTPKGNSPLLPFFASSLSPKGSYSIKQATSLSFSFLLINPIRSSFFLVGTLGLETSLIRVPCLYWG